MQEGFLETSNALSCLGYGYHSTYISPNVSNRFSACILYSLLLHSNFLKKVLIVQQGKQVGRNLFSE